MARHNTSVCILYYVNTNDNERSVNDLYTYSKTRDQSYGPGPALLRTVTPLPFLVHANTFRQIGENLFARFTIVLVADRIESESISEGADCFGLPTVYEYVLSFVRECSLVLTDAGDSGLERYWTLSNALLKRITSNGKHSTLEQARAVSTA